MSDLKKRYLSAVLRGHAIKGAPHRVRLMSEQELYETFLTIKDDDTYETYDDFKKFFPAEAPAQQQAPQQQKRQINKTIHQGDRLVTKDGFDATTVLEADKKLQALRNEEGLQAMQILSRIPGVPIKVEFKKSRSKKPKTPPAPAVVTGTEG